MQKTAYEMRISDWSSDVCSSDLRVDAAVNLGIDSARLVVDPGFGFGKTKKQDFLLLRGLERIQVRGLPVLQIGRAPCRERVCQYVYISVVAVYLKKKIMSIYLVVLQNITRYINIKIHLVM